MVESQDRLELETLRNKKLCIIGDGGAGKTCVLFRLKNNAFNDKDYSPTIFENELIKYDWKGKTVELRLVSSFFCFFF